MQHTKRNFMPLVFCFGKDAVFVLAFCVDTNPMLCQTAEHVFAFSHVDSLTIDSDFIDARVFEAICPAIAF
jgi:hypothetical protein